MACTLVIFTSVAVGQTDYTSPLSGGENPLDGIPSPGNAVITGDFDNDGDIDVLAYDNSKYNSFSFFANDGSGSFSEATGSDNPFSGLAVSDIFYASIFTIVADFDNDGDQDICDYEGSSSGDGENIYLENNDGNSFTSSLAGSSNPLSAVPDTDDGVITGDFDSDGDVDVLAFDDDSYNSFTFYANDGAGNFSSASGSDNPFSGLSATDLFYDSNNVYVQDFDDDGDFDIWDYEGNSDDIYLKKQGSPSSNATPTDISLSSTTTNQSGGVNATIGTLSTSDPDAGDTHTIQFDQRY